MFTSDAKNRWAVNWVTWPGFDRLWANIFRDLLPHAPQSETSADFDRASNELVVDYRLSRNVEEPAAMPDIFAFGPNGFQAPLKVSKVAAGHYRGTPGDRRRTRDCSVCGRWPIRAAFPEVGFYRQEDEMLEYGNNEPLLRQIAAATGGRYNPAATATSSTPAAAASARRWTCGRACWRWPSLLNLAELVLRKWKGVLEALHLRPAVQEA